MSYIMILCWILVPLQVFSYRRSEPFRAPERYFLACRLVRAIHLAIYFACLGKYTRDAIIMIFARPSSRHVIRHLMIMMIIMTTMAMTMLLFDGQTIQLTFQHDLLPLASKIVRCKLTKRISRKFEQDGVHKPCMQRETLPGVVLTFSNSVRNF
jgi:hypothetical protein